MRRQFCFSAVLWISGKAVLGGLLLCLVQCAGCADQEPPPAAEEPGCDVTAFVPEALPGKETEVMVPMRDCLRLSTDIYLPREPGVYPAILMRLPYDKERGILEFPVTKLLAALFVASDYAVVIQDTRGRFDSEGIWYPFAREQEDGLDTVRWIEAQPWFNGSLGMFGASYFGFTELAVAHQRPACLKTVVPFIISSDIYSWLFYAGLPRADLVFNWSLGMYEKDQFDELPLETFERAALHWPLIEGDDATVGDAPWLNDWLDHPFDDGFYDAFLPADVVERVEVPMLMLSGWFDIFLTGQLRDFQTARAGERVPGQTRIIIGPWTHEMGFFEKHDYRFRDPRSVISFIDPVLNWYAHYLKGEPLQSWGPVTVYDPGTGAWGDRPDLWPSARRKQVLYLQGDQGAAACAPVGTLAAAPGLHAASLTYTYDPLDPLVMMGGPLLGMASGCLREEPHCDRPDVLTFESAALTQPLTLDGDIRLHLSVSSSAPDTAFIGRLALVQADGRAYYLRQGVATLSHRRGDLRPAAYAPGAVVEIRMDMPPVLWTLQPGERLRLELCSSSFPSVAQHPNVAAAWFRERHPRPAEQTIHLLPDAPARLVLTVDR